MGFTSDTCWFLLIKMLHRVSYHFIVSRTISSRLVQFFSWHDETLYVSQIRWEIPMNLYVRDPTNFFETRCRNETRVKNETRRWRDTTNFFVSRFQNETRVKCKTRFRNETRVKKSETRIRNGDSMETTEDRVSSLHISSLVLFFVFLKRNIVQVNVLKCRWRQPCIQTTRKQKHGNHAAKNQRVLTLEVDGNILKYYRGGLLNYSRHNFNNNHSRTLHN